MIRRFATVALRLCAGLLLSVATYAASAGGHEGEEKVQSATSADGPPNGAIAGASDSNPKQPHPSLPGALREPPNWLVKGAPFDVVRYFQAIPDGENAAPLYLEALFEFSPGSMQRCVSPEEWEAHGPSLQERERRADECSRQEQPNDSRETKDRRARLVEEYRAAFDKLAQAQSRKRCLFETGYGFGETTGEPLASPRRAVLLLRWRVEARIDSGNLAGAIDDVEAALRLSRDLRPRGSTIRQLMSLVLDEQVAGKMIRPILAAEGLAVADCDRLLRIIAGHRRDAVDPLAEGFRGEYLVFRELLHRLEVDPKTRAEFQLTDSLAPMTAADFASEVDALNRYFRPLIHRGTRQPRELDRTLPEQQQAAAEMKILGELVAALSAAIGSDSKWEVAAYLESSCLVTVGVYRRCQTHLGAVQCLVALRRWQLEHGDALPADLASLCRAAGLRSVPVDEFSAAGELLRATIRDGEFVIYSVAEDGVDDGAQLERDFRKPESKGDWIFRLPRSEGQ